MGQSSPAKAIKTEPIDLAALLLSALGGSARADLAALIDLEVRLARLWRAASRDEEWVSAHSFLIHLGGRLGDAAQAVRALDEVHAADLHLACAVSLGVERALVAFEERYFGEIDRLVERESPADLDLDDLKQLVREKLFVGSGLRGPAIADYCGRGPLRNWFRITIARTFINLTRRGARESPGAAEEFSHKAWAGLDPELGYMKELYRVEFEQAFGQAVAELDRRNRALLRYTLIDQLTVAQIGRIYEVHVSTVARWLAEMRSTLLARLRSTLLSRLGLSQPEFESILRLVRSRIELDLEPLSGAAAPMRPVERK